MFSIMTNIISYRMQFLCLRLCASSFIFIPIYPYNIPISEYCHDGGDFLVIWGSNKCIFQPEGKLTIVTKRTDLDCSLKICALFLTFLMASFFYQGSKLGYSTEFRCHLWLALANGGLATMVSVGISVLWLSGFHSCLFALHFEKDMLQIATGPREWANRAEHHLTQSLQLSKPSWTLNSA